MIEWQGWVSLGVFLAAYILFIVFPKHRTFVALGGAAALVISQIISIPDAFYAINWNVMGIFVGTLFVADVFIESRVPAFIAERIIDRAPSSKWAILFICLLVSVISAFVENVAALLIVAPVALALTEKLNINPVKILIALAISSNLQGTATLIGDPPSMLLGGYAKMNFMDFFFFHNRPSIFFAVEIGAIAAFFVLIFIFRRHKGKVPHIPVEKVETWVPTITLVLLILALAVSSFFDTGFSFLAGAICMVAGIFSFVWKLIRKKGSFLGTLKNLDWDTTGFLVGVFILVGSLSATGWIDLAADFLSHVAGGSLFFSFILIVTVSVVLSAFIDNVPYLAAMLPVTAAMASRMNLADPSVLFFGLLVGASLGGNITPIGASANIVATGILRKLGHKVTFRGFTSLGLPFTLAATVVACVFVWLVWGI